MSLFFVSGTRLGPSHRDNCTCPQQSYINGVSSSGVVMIPLAKSRLAAILRRAPNDIRRGIGESSTSALTKIFATFPVFVGIGRHSRIFPFD